MNVRTPQLQHLHNFRLLEKDFDRDCGEVTASMKVKRASIAEKYSVAMDAMYGYRAFV